MNIEEKITNAISIKANEINDKLKTLRGLCEKYNVKEYEDLAELEELLHLADEFMGHLEDNL